MKTKVLSILILTLLVFASCKTEQKAKTSFNDGWKFKLMEETESEDNTFQNVDFDDATWTNVSLPHTANIEPLVVNDQWQGISWYRKAFTVPANLQGKKVVFEFEAAMNHSKFWINGEEITIHQGGYLPVVFDASQYLKFGEENIIAVRLNNKDNATTGPKPLKILDFNMYGGLYRNAWMIVKDKVHITHPILAEKVAGGGTFISYPKVSEEESIVKVKTNIANEYSQAKDVLVNYTVYFDDKAVKTIASEATSIAKQSDVELVEEFSIANAQLWSPASPNLYTLVTEVVMNGEVIDSEKTRFGIREFIFKGQDLYINGIKTYLRGTNRHQEYSFIGYALSDNAQYRDAKKIKDGGFDYIRLSHYPHSKSFMEACDELGLVVVDAILGWQYYNDDDKFRNYCYSSARNLIRRDRNHACVLSWEVSLNETKMPIFFMQKLHDIVHEEYPEPYAYSCGWMDDVYDIYFQARQHRILHPHDTITKPYMVSEYGDWEYHSNNAGLNQDKVSRTMRAEKSSRQLRGFGEERLLNQAYNVQEAYNDNMATSPAYADGYWVMYDYNRGYHDEIEASGVMDIFRLPKFAYYFYQSQSCGKTSPMVNIATYWNEKSPLSVKVYSNADKVKLSLNGKEVATQTPDTDVNSSHLPHPPYTFEMPSFVAGELKAEAYIAGELVAEHVVKTAEKPVELKVWMDESGKVAEAGCNDVVFVYAAAVDANGTVVPDYSEKVNVTIAGDAEIMNLDPIEAEAGIATALVRIGDKGGKLSVEAVSGALKGKYQVAIK